MRRISSTSKSFFVLVTLLVWFVPHIAHGQNSFASRLPGWISASIHRSLDETRVVNYAQSKDLQSAQNIITALRGAGWLDRNKALG